MAFGGQMNCLARNDFLTHLMAGLRARSFPSYRAMARVAHGDIGLDYVYGCRAFWIVQTCLALRSGCSMLRSQGPGTPCLGLDATRL